MNLSHHGYVRVHVDGKYVFEHVLVAEKALGRKLPAGAVVHHVNEIRTDNRPENLVICPSRAYHGFLHARMRGLAAIGSVHGRSCRFCKQHSLPEDLRSNGTSFYHPACHAKWHREYRLRRQ